MKLNFLNPRPRLCSLVIAIGFTAFAFVSTSVSAESPVRATSAATDTSEWTSLRGNDGSGYVASGSLPSSWTDNDYRWRRKLGSRDVGSVAVAGDKVFLLASKPDQKKISLESLDLTSGQLLWSRDYTLTPHHLHARNSFASSTPAADASNVYVAWGEPEHTYLKCFDHAGKEVWSRDFGSWKSDHGFGTSPRIIGNMVVFLNSQQADELPPGETPGESRMIAVDRATGESIWTSPLKATRTCYGVPAIYQAADGTTQIIDANTGNGLFGLDAATGKMLWSRKVFDKRCVSTPIIIGDLAIGSCGSGGGGNRLVAVRIPGTPGAEVEEVYAIDRFAPYVPTPVLKNGRLYMVSDTGIASCADGATGEAIWSKRVGGNYGSSPIVVGDKMLIISLDGKATILGAGDEFKVLGEVDLGGAVGASPSYVDGNLLLRVDDELRCLGGDAA